MGISSRARRKLYASNSISRESRASSEKGGSLRAAKPAWHAHYSTYVFQAGVLTLLFKVSANVEAAAINSCSTQRPEMAVRGIAGPNVSLGSRRSGFYASVLGMAA